VQEEAIKSFMNPKIDCRHFRGSRPCAPHKRENVVCDGCPHYDPCSLRILVVKLAADGDVLRTTCLLPSLRRKYPRAQITWITEKSAAPLLENNPLIDRIWAPPERHLAHLANERFDLVFNTDADPLSCHLATLARARKKLGFTAGMRGEPVPKSLAAERWFQMGIWDHVKRANRQTYPAIIHQIAGVRDVGSSPLLNLTAKEISEAQKVLATRGWRRTPGRPVMGINTGAGKRWPQKSLPLATLEKVIGRLSKARNVGGILLLGGPSERERNHHLAKTFGSHVVDTGTDNSLRQFAALVSQVDVLLTGDTLALHIGLALRKHVVVHFGPTSPWEIELYGSGEKIIPEMECVSCYCNECPKTPKCNELINPASVAGSLLRGMSASPRAHFSRAPFGAAAK
jgi:ADP-heptose:LPS heptosyltransferase